jgi:hypothetical protein
LSLRREWEWFERCDAMPSSQTATAAIVSLSGTPLMALVMSKASLDCCFGRRDGSAGSICLRSGPATRLPAAEDANVNRDWLAAAACAAAPLARLPPAGLHDQGARFAARGARRQVLVAAREGVGLIVGQADMPLTDSDHALTSRARMSVGIVVKMIELIGGRRGSRSGVAGGVRNSSSRSASSSSSDGF